MNASQYLKILARFDVYCYQILAGKHLFSQGLHILQSQAGQYKAEAILTQKGFLRHESGCRRWRRGRRRRGRLVGHEGWVGGRHFGCQEGVHEKQQVLQLGADHNLLNQAVVGALLKQEL